MVPPSAQFLHGFAQAVRLDVGDERVELLAFHQGEDVGEWMKLEAIGSKAALVSLCRGALLRKSCRASPLAAAGLTLFRWLRRLAAVVTAVPVVLSVRCLRSPA
jgi:hypothetical protein